MALDVATRDPVDDGDASHCQYCGRKLEEFGYHFTCHVCGAKYCYIHLGKHNLAHQLSPRTVLAR